MSNFGLSGLKPFKLKIIDTFLQFFAFSLAKLSMKNDSRALPLSFLSLI